MNLRGSEDGHKETKKIKNEKSPYQKRYRETGRQSYKYLFSLKSMVLVMTKTFNIVHIFFLSGFSSHENSRITGLQRKGDIVFNS